MTIQNQNRKKTKKSKKKKKSQKTPKSWPPKIALRPSGVLLVFFRALTGSEHCPNERKKFESQPQRRILELSYSLAWLSRWLFWFCTERNRFPPLRCRRLLETWRCSDDSAASVLVLGRNFKAVQGDPKRKCRRLQAQQFSIDVHEVIQLRTEDVVRLQKVKAREGVEKVRVRVWV